MELFTSQEAMKTRAGRQTRCTPIILQPTLGLHSRRCYRHYTLLVLEPSTASYTLLAVTPLAPPSTHCKYMTSPQTRGVTALIYRRLLGIVVAVCLTGGSTCMGGPFHTRARRPWPT